MYFYHNRAIEVFLFAIMFGPIILRSNLDRLRVSLIMLRIHVLGMAFWLDYDICVIDSFTISGQIYIKFSEEDCL